MQDHKKEMEDGTGPRVNLDPVSALLVTSCDPVRVTSPPATYSTLICGGQGRGAAGGIDIIIKVLSSSNITEFFTFIF